MILLIDNYDSFTHNLYQYLSQLTTEEVRVIRNDAISLSEIEELNPSRIVISPGPGRPDEAGISIEVIKHFAERTPILGVCLGHQAIGEAFGGEIVQAQEIRHGKSDQVTVDGKGVFRSIDSPSEFIRYHSLAIREETLPEVLEVTARSSDGEIMGVRHRTLPVEGVQFHPESIGSEEGMKLLSNFLNYRREPFQPRRWLERLLQGESMTQEEAAAFMEELTDGNLTDAQIAAFLVALNGKGITAPEVAGCAAVLQRKRVPISPEESGGKPLLDTCGTGGDGLGTFNISSLTALAAASCGAVVAKHGNRAISSRSGSADFYRALGINIEISPERAAATLRETNFTFLYAPLYHGAMRFAAPARRQLGIKTIMNLLGPLVNPAGAEYQLIGVFSEEYLPIMAHAAVRLGVKRGLVVHGLDGQDEISVTTNTRGIAFSGPGRTEANPEERERQGTFEEVLINPEECGITLHPATALAGGTAEENAAVARTMLSGTGDGAADPVVHALRDSIAINAGAALMVYGIVPTIAEGVQQVQEALGSGAVAATLERVIQATT